MLQKHFGNSAPKMTALNNFLLTPTAGTFGKLLLLVHPDKHKGAPEYEAFAKAIAGFRSFNGNTQTNIHTLLNDPTLQDQLQKIGEAELKNQARQTYESEKLRNNPTKADLKDIEKDRNRRMH